MAGKGVVGKLSVKVVPDTDGFLRKLKKDLRKIKRAVGDLEIKVEAEVVLDKESLARVKRQLEGLDAEAYGTQPQRSALAYAYCRKR